MSKMSKAEQTFREKYPNTRVVTEPSGVRGMQKHVVLAGDYLCAEGLSRGDAFKRALDYETSGSITPDPTEQASGDVDVRSSN